MANRVPNVCATSPAPVTPQVRATHPPPPAASCPAVTATMRLGDHDAVLGHHQAFAPTRRPQLPGPAGPLSQDTGPRRRLWAARGRSDGGAIRPRVQSCVSWPPLWKLDRAEHSDTCMASERSIRPASPYHRHGVSTTEPMLGHLGLSTAKASTSSAPAAAFVLHQLTHHPAGTTTSAEPAVHDQHWKRGALGINNRTGCPC